MRKCRPSLALACAFLVLPWAGAPAQSVVLRLAETHPVDYPTTRADLEFARLVAERSGGRIRIEVYAGSQLGQERAVIEQVQFGGIDMTRVSLSVMASFVPVLDALQMPYLYRDNAHMWKVLKGDIGEELLASLDPFDFVGLGWFEAGSRNFYNSKRAVRVPSDLRGLRIRVQESEFMMGLVAAFGAVPVPMAYGEVYSALQTGVVDGAENNWPSYYSTSHYEVAKYITLDEHTCVPEIIVGSKISLGMLSPADRELIKKAAFDAVDFQRAEWSRYERVSIDKVKAAGNAIVEIADKSAWQSLMAPLYARQAPEIRKLIERVKAVK
jgi:tripartite ATP-independent transporter DctP family solute receptor